MSARISAAAPTEGSRLWVQWTLSNRGCPTVVVFAGELDAANADQLVETLTAAFEACTDRLIIDLSAVAFADAAGATALLRARRLAQARSLRLDVVTPASAPRRVLTVDGDDEEVEFYDTLVDALRGTAATPSTVTQSEAATAAT